MYSKKSRFLNLLIITTVFISFNGCTIIFQKGRRVDVEKISKLKGELSDLEKAKNELEDKLKNEIGQKDVNVQMLDKGLVITFVAEVLFDSGKNELKQEAYLSLDKISDVLKTTVKDLSIGIEGHTDNVPIKYSGWKSNWELSSARALSVLYYLEDEQKINSNRLSATGYGEHRPIATNDTAEGRQKNRRVEIVIIPKIEKKGR